MPDPITTFAIDNGGPYNVVARSYCRRIEIRENYNSQNPPTADLQQFKPAGSSTPAAVSKGTSAIFTTLTTFYPGQVVGAVNTLAGSITVAQIEGGEI